MSQLSDRDRSVIHLIDKHIDGVLDLLTLLHVDTSLRVRKAIVSKVSNLDFTQEINRYYINRLFK